MSLPSRSEAFRVGTTDKVSAALWNAVFEQVCGELNGLDALKADVEAAIIAAANGNLDAVLQGQLAGRLTTTAAAFDALKVAIEQAQEQLALIQSGIVIGSSVQITPAGMFADTTSVQDAVEQLSAAIDDDPAFASKMARLSSPAFTDNPTAPTAPAGDNDKTIANTEFVRRALDAAALDGMAYALAWGS